MQGTRADGLSRFGCQRCNVSRHIGKWRHNHHTFGHAVPGVGSTPATVKNGLGSGDVVRPPVIHVSGKLCLGPKLNHVRSLTKGMQATLSGCLKCCGTVRVLGNNVSTLIHQHLGGVSLLGRIKPGIHPDHLNLDVRVDRMGAEQKGINAADDFGNWEGGDITYRVGF